MAQENTNRLLSLDAFRGMTLAGMIVVNSPGNDASYWMFRHARWSGWTPTDLIFPFFLFIMGAAVPFALARRKERGESDARMLWQALRRSVILFVLGLPGGVSVDPDGFFRIPGVLQRIALCYLASVLAFLKGRARAQALAVAALWAGYWWLLSTHAAPGHPAGDLTPEGNLASFVDRWLMGQHLYERWYDPEGLLSTLPAIGNALAGVLAGEWLRSSREPREKAAWMFAAGLGAIAIGRLWGEWLPFIKNIWTPSFAMFSTGMALCLFAACYWIIDIRARRRWALPFEVFGVNAITVYCAASLGYSLLTLWRRPRLPFDAQTFRLLWCGRLFGSWLPPPAASLAWAVFYTALWWLLMWLLYRKKIFIKI